MSPARPTRSRALRLGVGGMIVLVAIVAVGLRIFRSALPLTPDEAIRVARAEVARLDPEHSREAVLFDVSAKKVNAGRPWSWAYHWQVLIKRKDRDTGYMVEINGREDVKLGRAFNIKSDSWAYDQPM